MITANPAERNETVPDGLTFKRDHLGRSVVQPSKEFRNYAANCEGMAELSKDSESKALWMRMAERWTLGADLAEEEERAVRDKERPPSAAE